MSKKITSQDIFDDKIFDKIKSDANSFKTTLENLKTQFSAILGQQQQFLQQKVSFASAADLKKLNDVLEQNKALRQSLIAIQNKLNQVQNQGASTTSKLTKEKVREAEARKRKRKELVDEIALEEKQNVSLNKLLASSRKLRRERADLDLATAKGRQRLQEINVQLDKNNALIRKNSDALKKQRLNVGNYSSALGNAVGKLRNLAGAFGLVAGAAGVVSIFRNAIGVFRTFEQVQTDLASILQKTREETVGLSEAAKDLGATTFFTATEVSKLQVELAKLGFDTQQIIDSEEAILNLAAAFSIDLPQAAKVVASTLNGFQLEADESARVADVLAKSFAKSALDIEKFEVAISKVAPIAAGLGIDIETTTAALGKLVSAGFDASTAGTQFRNILLKLSDPSSELANTLGLTVDSSEDLVQAFKTLNKEQLSIAKAQGLIDVRSVALLKSLSDNADGVQELREELEGAAGTAEDIAGNQLKTLNGSFRLLSSAYEGFILSVEDGTGAIGEFLKSVVQVATGVFNLLTGTEKARESFSQLSPEIQALAQNIVNFFTVLTDTVKTLFEYRRAIIAAFIALKSYQALLVLSTTALGLYQKATVLARIASIAFSGGLKGVTRALKLLNLAIKANPIGLLASALALLGSVLVTFLADWLLFGESTEDVNENLDKSAEKIENIEEKVKNLKKELKDFTKIRNIFQDVLAGSVEVLVKASDPELQKALQEANKRLEKTVRDLRVAEVNLANDLEGKYSKAIQKNIKDLEGQEDVLRKIIGSIKDEQEARKEALRGEGEETGILNRKRAELAAERKSRDAADTRGAIANSNVRIKALQDEIKELENLGLTAEESKKKLDKLRTSLDKLAIKSANDFDQALKDIDLEEFNKQIFEVETELKSLDSKFSAISDTLTDEEAFATSRGRGLFFRTGIISRNELEGLLSEAEEFTARKIKLIDEEAEARNQALINERQAQERTILEQRQLRDADLKRRLEELDILEESGLIDPKDIQAERDKANDLIAESEAIFLAQQGALQEKFLNEQSVLYQEAEEQKTKATIEQAAIREEAVNKRFDLIRDSLLEEIDLYAEYVQKVIDLTQQKVDRQNEIEAKALAEDTRLRERAADQQFQRAIAGQDNILQFQERKLAEARIREQRAAEQAAKREEAIRLTSVYFQALEARLAEAVTNQNLTKKNKTPLSGVTSGNAALFALKDTFLAEALSRSIAGAFATGVENFQGKGTETSDSNLIAFSHGESVVTAKGTKENRGLVTAMNKGMVDEYFKTMWLPKFQMDNSPSLIANFVNKDNKSDDKLAKKIEELTQVMANKPVQQVHVDSFGNIIETSYQNGLKTVIKHQTKKIL